MPTDTYLGTITDAITFAAWDQTSGTAGTYADTTNNGGHYAFSTATDTVSMTIDPAVGAETQANSDSTGYALRRGHRARRPRQLGRGLDDL